VLAEGSPVSLSPLSADSAMYCRYRVPFFRSKIPVSRQMTAASVKLSTSRTLSLPSRQPAIKDVKYLTSPGGRGLPRSGSDVCLKSQVATAKQQIFVLFSRMSQSNIKASHSTLHPFEAKRRKLIISRD
jgi:hypothetical protein